MNEREYMRNPVLNDHSLRTRPAVAAAYLLPAPVLARHDALVTVIELMRLDLVPRAIFPATPLAFDRPVGAQGGLVLRSLFQEHLQHAPVATAHPSLRAHLRVAVVLIQWHLRVATCEAVYAQGESSEHGVCTEQRQHSRTDWAASRALGAAVNLVFGQLHELAPHTTRKPACGDAEGAFVGQVGP